MARVRKFDEAQAKEAAMIAFWRYGYSGASYDRLVTMTGASRKGLYSIWPDKAALFRDCLELYLAKVAARFLERIEADDMTPERFDSIWDQVGVTDFNGATIRGCLICRAKAETAFSGTHSFVGEIAEHHLRATSAAFAKALRRVWRKEPPSSDADLRDRAGQAATASAALAMLVGCDFEPGAASMREIGRGTRL